MPDVVFVLCGHLHPLPLPVSSSIVLQQELKNFKTPVVGGYLHHLHHHCTAREVAENPPQQLHVARLRHELEALPELPVVVALLRPQEVAEAPARRFALLGAAAEAPDPVQQLGRAEGARGT